MNKSNSKSKADEIVEKRNLVVVTIKPENFSNGSDQGVTKGIKANVNLKKYENILLKPKWGMYFEKLWRIKGNEYHWSSGEYWNLDIPFRGSGWGETSWEDITTYHPRSVLWQTQYHSALQFYFLPGNNVSFIIKGKFKYSNEFTQTTVHLNH